MSLENRAERIAKFNRENPAVVRLAIRIAEAKHRKVEKDKFVKEFLEKHPKKR